MSLFGIVVRVSFGAGILVTSVTVSMGVVWLVMWIWEQEWFKVGFEWAAFIGMCGLIITGLVLLSFIIGSAVLK